MDNKKRIGSIAGCLAIQLCLGILYVWSIFRQPAIDFFGWDTGAANLVSSVMLFAFCGGNFLGGSVQDRIGPKKACMIGVALFGAGVLASSFLKPGCSVFLFYLTYGAAAGLGSGFAYGPVLCCIQRWIPNRRGFATGLAASVFGFSTVVFSPVINALISKVGISKCFLILGIGFLAIGAVACLFISLPAENTAGTWAKTVSEPAAAGSEAARDNAGASAASQAKACPADDGSRTLGQAVKTLPLWLIFIGCFFYNGTWNMLTPLIKGLGMERGLSDGVATLCVSLTGVANASGRLLMSSLSDKLGRTKVLIALSFATLTSAVLLTFSGNGLYFFAVLLTAFAFGGPAAINPAITADIYGSRHSGANYGLVMMALGISSVVFNAVSNALTAATGSYTMTFVTGAVIAAFSAVIYFIIGRLGKRKM